MPMMRNREARGWTRRTISPRSQQARALASLGVLVLVWLVASPALAYRTLAEDPTLGVTGLVRHRDLPVRVRLYAPSLSASDQAALEDALISALDAWQAPTCTGFRAAYGGLTGTPAAAGDGVSTIEVVAAGWLVRDLPPGRGATTDVQLAREAVSGHAEITEADVYLNFDEHEFSMGAATVDALDAHAVILHELGHLLGLGHPCGDSGAPACGDIDETSALFPIYGGLRALSDDDRAGVCALYPGDVCVPSCAEGSVCLRGMCVDTCSGSSCEPPPDGCTDGSCADEACLAESDCSHSVCSYFGVSTGRCVPPGSTGAACAHGEDCASGLCLASSQLGRSVCTRACTFEGECGVDQRCAAVADASVCAPLEPPAGGCSAASSRTGHTGVGCVLLASGWVVFRSRRRGKK